MTRHHRARAWAATFALGLAFAGCGGPPHRPDNAPTEPTFVPTPTAPDPGPNKPASAPTAASAPVEPSGPRVEPAPTGPSTLAASRARYRLPTRHSPISEQVVANLQRILARGSQHPERFAKVGDSNTVAPGNMLCFESNNVKLDAYSSLQATLSRLLATTGQFTRESLAAGGGWAANAVIGSSPSRLQEELDESKAAFSIVQFGTNDVGYDDADWFSRNMWTLVRQAIERGNVPVLGTIPPNLGKPTYNARIPEYNGIIRALAEVYQIPLFDLHSAIIELDGGGFVSDGVHFNSYSAGGSKPCFFTAQALGYGHNVRNLLQLESLDRLLRYVIDREPPQDFSSGYEQLGSGTKDSPFVVGELPFAHSADTQHSHSRNLAEYTGCAAGQNEGGPEYLYVFDVSREITVRARVTSQSGVDVDVHILAAEPTESACLIRHDKVATWTLQPGRYFFALDTFVSAGLERAGAYLFMLDEIDK